MAQIRTKLTVCLTLFCAALTVGNDACAQLAMRVISAGFGDLRCARDAWIPVSVLISNRGKDVEGELHVYTVERYGNKFRRVGLRSYIKPVNIPRNSRKIFTVYYRDETPGFLRVEIKGKEGSRKAIAAVTLRRPLRPLWGAYPVLALGNVESIRSFLVNARIDDASVTTLSNPDRGLPDRAIGYDCLEAIFANGYDFTRLSRTQQNALLEWVASGGHLVVSFSAQTEMGDSAISGALPLLRKGSTKAPDLNAVATFSGGGDLLGETLLAAGDLRGEGVNVLLTQEGTPIIIEARHGLGRVTYLAFDVSQPPIRGWPGNPKLAARLLRSGRRRADASRISYFASRVLQNTRALKPPSFGSIGLFLLVYILLIGPANYFVLKRIRKKEWVSWTIPVIVVVFTIGCYFAGYLMKGGKVQLTKLHVVKMREGSPRAHVTTYLGLFSPARTSYDVAVDDPTVSWSTFDMTYWRRRRRETRGGVDFVQSDRWTLRDLKASMWSMRALQATHRADLGELTSNLSISNTTLRGTITNKTDYAFSSAVILVGGAFAELNGLNVNQTLDVASKLVGRPSGVKFLNQLGSMSRGYGMNAYQLMATMLSIGRRSWLERAIFIGIADADLLKVRTNGEEASSESRALFFVELPLVREGKSIELAPGMTPHRVSNGHTYGLGVSFSDEADVEFELPFRSMKVEVERLGFVIRYQKGYNTPFTLKLYDWRAKRWQEIPQSDFSSVTSPERYINPDTSAVRARLTSPNKAWVYLSQFDLTFKGRYK